MNKTILDGLLNGKEYPFFKSMINNVVQGDTIAKMKELPDNSVDLLLVDLPYGTTQNKWDSVIPLPDLWEQYHRVVKENDAMIFTVSGMFTAKLILSNPKDYKYNYTWIKSKATNFLNAKKQPLRKHEDILVFYRKQPTYNPQMTSGSAYSKGIRKDQITGSYGDFRPVLVKSKGKDTQLTYCISKLQKLRVKSCIPPKSLFH